MNKKLIWIVDDDSIFKIIIKKLIAKFENFENVLTFSNGEEACRAFKETLDTKQKLPDVILLDIEMPIMDGWEFMNQFNILKDDFKDQQVDVFILSSSITIEDKLRAKNNPNIKGYITKPISLTDIEKIIS